MQKIRFPLIQYVYIVVFYYLFFNIRRLSRLVFTTCNRHTENTWCWICNRHMSHWQKVLLSICLLLCTIKYIHITLTRENYLLFMKLFPANLADSMSCFLDYSLEAVEFLFNIS
jgi:hypothetical protein